MTVFDQGKSPAQTLWEETFFSATQQPLSHILNNVVILGHERNGKRTLLSMLRHRDFFENGEGGAIEYSCMTVDASSMVPTAGEMNLNLWMVDDPKFQEMLPLVLNERNIQSSVAIITVDLSVSEEIAEKALECLELLQRHVETIHSKMELNQINDMKKKVEDLCVGNQLNINLGLPIIIVGCKSDAMAPFEEDKKQVILNDIEKKLRTISLDYGAALIYTSCKEHRKIDLLMNYLLHNLLGKKYKGELDIKFKDSLFIPAGLDTEDEIKQIPVSNMKPKLLIDTILQEELSEGTKHEVKVETLQQFLQRMFRRQGRPAKISKHKFEREAKARILLPQKKAPKSQDTEAVTNFFHSIKNSDWAQRFNSGQRPASPRKRK